MNWNTGYEPISWNLLEVIERQIAAEKFDRLNRDARWGNLWNRLTGRPRTLLSYGCNRFPFSMVFGLDRGVREIPVRSIVGSVSRVEDFDRQFRPLNRALKSRWIDVHMLTERTGWEPIVVHKIGDQYFVVDGHHRVSIARNSGWETIEAQVYE